MSWKFCLSGSAIAMAGENANSDLKSYALKTIMDKWSDESEGSVEMESGKALSGSWSLLSPGVHECIGNVCASKIAMKIIAYDTTGYLSREADTLLNVNKDIIVTGLAKIKDFKNLTLKDPI